MTAWTYDDGGRAAAGFKGEAGDCGVRAAAIVTGLPYREVYDEINAIAKTERPKRGKRSNSRTGLWPSTLERYLGPRGWIWVPTMGIGTGCTVHVRADELPAGKILVRASRHYIAVLDGIAHDIHDSTRDGTRCCYGYWQDTR